MWHWTRLCVAWMVLGRLSHGKGKEVNVALGKPSYQSTDNEGWISANCNDGNTDPHIFSNTCCHLELELNPWWLLDLGRTFSINKVTVYSRDSYPYQIQNATIATGSHFDVSDFDPDSYQVCATVPASTMAGEVLTLPCAAVGRYLTVYKHYTTPQYMSMCELKVWTELSNEWRVTKKSRHVGPLLTSTNQTRDCSVVLCGSLCLNHQPEFCVGFNLGQVEGSVNKCTCQLVSEAALPLVPGDLQTNADYVFYTFEELFF